MWHDAVFVNLDGKAPDLETYLAPLNEQAKDFDISQFAYSDTVTGEFNCNWKLAVENWSDVYHVFAVHPLLNKMMDNSQRTGMTTHGNLIYCRWGYDRATLEGEELPIATGLDGQGATTSFNGHLFPGLCISFHPTMFLLWDYKPTSHDWTRLALHIYYAGEAARSEEHAQLRQQKAKYYTGLNAEDDEVCRLLQLGRSARGYDGGRLAPYWDQGPCISPIGRRRCFLIRWRDAGRSHKVVRLAGNRFCRRRIAKESPQVDIASFRKSSTRTAFRYTELEEIVVSISERIDGKKLERDLASGWGFPVELYLDPEWYAVEQRSIFQKSWFCVGTTHRLQNSGDVILGYANDIPVMVTRDRDGEIHALINVCRHRAHPVCRSEGNHKILTCPYHGWSYGLNGKLRGAPGSDDEEIFTKDDFCLRTLPVELWGFMIFVAASPDMRPLDLHYPAFKKVADLRQFDHDPAHYSFHRRYTSTADANWKFWYDNTLECFHCPSVHSDSFNKAYAVEAKDYETLIEDRIVSYFFPPKPKKSANALQVTFNRHLHLFPGFFATQQDDIMLVHQMRPLGIDRTTVFWDILAADGADPVRIEGWCRIWEETLIEDKLAVEAVQQHASPRTFTANRYMRSREPVPLHINQWIWSACKPELPH